MIYGRVWRFKKSWIVRDRKVLMQKKKDLGTITWHEVQVGNESRLCFLKMASLHFQNIVFAYYILILECRFYILRFLLMLQVLVFFIILILLWFFQSPKFIPGWADQFKASGENHNSL
jgi:hypothetical protein